MWLVIGKLIQKVVGDHLKVVGESDITSDWLVIQKVVIIWLIDLRRGPSLFIW